MKLRTIEKNGLEAVLADLRKRVIKLKGIPACAKKGKLLS